MTMFPHSRTHRMHHCEDAKFLTHTLGGIWRNDRGNAPCPVCQPERRRGQNALSISGTGGKLLLHCFKNGCSFAHITRAAGIVLGVVAIDRDGQKKSDNMRGRYNAKQATKAQADKRAAQAQRIWRESEPIVGTLAERYLRSRGIFRFFPDTLRFHPACWHATGKRIPTMVALVEGSEEFALHRTYLQSDGMGKTKAYPAKAMLGRCAGPLQFGFGGDGQFLGERLNGARYEAGEQHHEQSGESNFGSHDRFPIVKSSSYFTGNVSTNSTDC